MEGRRATSGAAHGSASAPTSAPPFRSARSRTRSSGVAALPAHVAAPLLAESRSDRRRGSASFTGRSSSPRSSATRRGEPRRVAGFDAIIGNPPWEMLRGDRGDADTTETARTAAARLTRLRARLRRLHAAGRRPRQPLSVVPRAHARAAAPRRPARHGAAVGAGDRPRRRAAAAGAPGPHAGRHAGLARESRRHVSRFTAASSSSCSPRRPAGARRPPSPAGSAFAAPEALDRLPELGPDPDAVTLTRPLLEQLSGEQIAVPDVRSPARRRHPARDRLHARRRSAIPAAGTSASGAS